MPLLHKLNWINPEHYSEINALEQIIINADSDNNKYLPKQISLIVENNHDFDSEGFLQNVATQIELEIQNRVEVIKTLFDSEGQIQAEKFLTGSTDWQPWVLLETKNGGLPQGHADLVTCFYVNNHGVANVKDSPNSFNSILVTARKENRDWNMDSDVGHEFGHASIAPIPFIGQQAQREDLTSGNKPILDINLDYPIVESINIILRGESRDNETGLAVIETETDLRIFVSRCAEQFPNCGFENIDVKNFINSNTNKGVFAIACMRVLSGSKSKYMNKY
jgi:hypothetical protein